MAATEFGTNDAQTVKLWSTKTAYEAIGQTWMRKLMGTSEDSILYMARDLEKHAGDTIRYDLLRLMTGAGVDGDTRLKGFEEALVYEQDTISINQKRQAHLFKGMSQQRTVHDLRQDGKRNLAKWYAEKYDKYMLAYLCGTAGDAPGNVSLELPFAGNAIVAPDAAHEHVTGATFELDDIDILVEIAQMATPRIQPAMVDGQPKYVLIIHPFTATEMRTATGADNWREITALARERSASNPLYTGALGEYAGVIIHVSEYIPRQISSPLTYNIFLGAQAGCIAFGNAWKRRQRGLGKGSYFSWHEDVDDYGNEEGIGVASIFGIKKTVYNSVDYATIRYVTTDDSHALP